MLHPPAPAPSLSPALMKAFHEECLRLSAKALQSQMTSQDANEASFWMGLVGQHFAETGFDDSIRTYAAKSLDRMLQTGIPLDYSSTEADLSKELSARVGWNVEGRIHPMFTSSLDEDTRRLRFLSANGISSSLIALSKALAQIAPIIPVSVLTREPQPHRLETVYTGFQMTNSVLSGAHLEFVNLPSGVCNQLSRTIGILSGAAGLTGAACFFAPRPRLVPSCPSWIGWRGRCGATHLLVVMLLIRP